MEKRNIEIKVRLNRKEHESLQKRVKKSGLSRETYLRFLIQNLVPQDLPPPDYHSMMRQLYGISNNLNQLAIKAHQFGMLDSRQYDENVQALNHAVLEIQRAVTLPQRVTGHPQNACILREEDAQRTGADIRRKADVAQGSL